MADNTYYACFLKKFNNYFNRIIKGYDTLAEYQSAAEDYFLYSKAINYNPADNVSTELIMNDCDFDPDYVLILDKELDIVARWFVLETIFTREKQRKFILRRDVIYDNKDSLLNSPVFVQKAMLSDGDPFILNSEGMSFNEIKTSETLLKDSSGSAWIIGYIAKNAAATTITVQTGAETITNYTNFSTIAQAMGVSTSDLASILNFGDQQTIPSYFTSKVEVRFGCSDLNLIPFLGRIRLYFSPDFTSLTSSDFNQVYSWTKTLFKYKRYDWIGMNSFLEDSLSPYFINNAANLSSSMETITGRKYFTSSQLEALRRYNGQTINYNGKYYKLQVAVSSSITEVFGPDAYTAYSAFETAINSAFADSSISDKATLHNDGEISIRPTSQECYVQLVETSPETAIPRLEIEISANRAKNDNAPFDMFAIPLNSILLSAGTTFQTKENIAKKIASAIATELDTACYDIQLLPYLPTSNAVSLFNGGININGTEGEDYNYIMAKNTIAQTRRSDEAHLIAYDSGTGVYQWGASVQDPLWPDDASNVFSITYDIEGSAADEVYDVVLGSYDPATQSIAITFKSNEDISDSVIINFHITYRGTEYQSVIIWCRTNSFSTQLSYSLTLKDSMKIESQCNKYRLVSPNYQGSFDFNVAKNGGSVAYFTAECTYKPYTPYIKITPAFEWLYGANYGDNRGLICGGDFSLPRFTDAWETYELNNKNYQNIFNREIQNLSFEQDLQMRQQLITGGLGVLTAGTVGAGVGAKAGGGWGALAGAIVGTAGSAAGLAIDTDMLARQQREQKSLAIDKFNYQLGNIKALPYTLTKIGAFDINSKIWPFIEYYTCTDEEKEALENKITYESMTVMRIDLFGTYFGAFSEPKYFKGELIRNEDIAEDNHIFEAIYSELLKGVYC